MSFLFGRIVHSWIDKIIQSGREFVSPPDVPRLAVLLKKNAYGGGLTNEEYAEAQQLIDETPDDKDKLCWACQGIEGREPRHAMQGLSICRGHAYHSLFTRK